MLADYPTLRILWTSLPWSWQVRLDSGQLSPKKRYRLLSKHTTALLRLHSTAPSHWDVLPSLEVLASSGSLWRASILKPTWHRLTRGYEAFFFFSLRVFLCCDVHKPYGKLFLWKIVLRRFGFGIEKRCHSAVADRITGYSLVVYHTPLIITMISETKGVWLFFLSSILMF